MKLSNSSSKWYWIWLRGFKILSSTPQFWNNNNNNNNNSNSNSNSNNNNNNKQQQQQQQQQQRRRNTTTPTINKQRSTTIKFSMCWNLKLIQQVQIAKIQASHVVSMMSLIVSYARFLFFEPTHDVWLLSSIRNPWVYKVHETNPHLTVTVVASDSNHQMHPSTCGGEERATSEGHRWLESKL